MSTDCTFNFLVCLKILLVRNRKNNVINVYKYKLQKIEIE